MMKGQGQGKTIFVCSFSLLCQPTSKSQAATISKDSIIVPILDIIAQAAKFDLTLKKVKFNPGLLCEQTMMGLSTGCYIPKFAKIEEEDF